MASKKKKEVEEELEDTKNKKLDPKDWEESEEDPEDTAPEGEESGDPAEEGAKAKGDEFADDVTVVPEPPRDNKPKGPRDAIWSCGEHETRGFENKRPNCRVSSCDKTTKLKIVYEEKQRRAKDPTKAG